MNECQFNSMMYDFYKVLMKNGIDVDQMKYIDSMFDEFYDLLEKEEFNKCEHVLKSIQVIIGRDNTNVVSARVNLDLEKY